MASPLVGLAVGAVARAAATGTTALRSKFKHSGNTKAAKKICKHNKMLLLLKKVRKL
jgi:hypothetical protein